MSELRELPDLVREFVDMSKEYLRQETLEPAKQLGKFAGLSLGAAAAFALGSLFLSVAAVRYIRDLLPEGPYWSALGYILAALLLALVAFILIQLTSRATRTEPVEVRGAKPEDLTIGVDSNQGTQNGN